MFHAWYCKILILFEFFPNLKFDRTIVGKSTFRTHNDTDKANF